METQPARAGATVHLFPAGGRAGMTPRKPAQTNVPAPRFGGAWYHEQAIKDTQSAGSPPRH